MPNLKHYSRGIEEIDIKIGDLVWCPAYGFGVIYKSESAYFYYILWSGKTDNDGVSYVSVKDARWFRELLISKLKL